MTNDQKLTNRKKQFEELHQKLQKLNKEISEEEKITMKLEVFKETAYDFIKIMRNGRNLQLQNHEMEIQNKVFDILGYNEVIMGYNEFLSTDEQELKISKPTKLDKSYIRRGFLKHPVIFDSKKEIFVIMNIGTPPKGSQTDFYTKDFIYPINYKIERVFRSYKNPNTVLVYTCVIKNKEGKISFEIYDNEKLLSAGSRNNWKSFRELTRMNYSDIILEDFFALSNKNVIGMIEKKTNLESLKGYIPLRMRHYHEN